MDGPVYIVIGAAGGIGRALTRRLSSNQAKLLLLSRNEQAIAALSQELPESLAFAVDATNFKALQGCFEYGLKHFGRVDGVVNLAGSILLKPAHRMKDEEWDDVINTNLRTAFNALRASVKVLRSNGGSVVLMSSAAARKGLPSHEAIAAAKAGVIGLTLSGAASYAPLNIRINAVAPGLVNTPLAAGIVNHPASLRASTSMHALGKIGQPDDVASMIEWLLSPTNTWVTGQVFGVDGGLGTLYSRS